MLTPERFGIPPQPAAITSLQFVRGGHLAIPLATPSRAIAVAALDWNRVASVANCLEPSAVSR